MRYTCVQFTRVKQNAWAQRQTAPRTHTWLHGSAKVYGPLALSVTASSNRDPLARLLLGRNLPTHSSLDCFPELLLTTHPLSLDCLPAHLLAPSSPPRSS
eukprot:726652-Pelagomonas_calceolata.AAC.1